MLSTDDVKAIVEPADKLMRDALGLSDWTVTVTYERDEDRMGSCSTMTSYQKATINIDPSHHDDEDEVLDTLRHELLHIVHDEFTILRTEENDRLHSHAAERTVLRMERMLDRLGFTPRKLGSVTL